MSKKSYSAMSVASKNADNFIRTYNKQLEKAYNTLGADSTIYKNLIANARNMEIRTNAKGVMQLSRSKANIENYNKNNAVRELKKRYYADPDKKTINPRYDVTKDINTKINALKENNIVPTVRQLKALTAIDEKISLIFTNYENSSGSVKTLYSDNIKELSDITSRYQNDPAGAYDDLQVYLSNHSELAETIKKVSALPAIELKQINDAPVSASELLKARENKFKNNFKW